MRFLLIGLGATLLSGLACSSSSDTTTPTFTQIYTNTIVAKCAPCHTTPTGDGVVYGKLDLTSQTAAYANLLNRPAAGDACAGKGTLITPGSADDSMFYLKVSTDDPSPCGEKMPLGVPPLSDDEADGIEAWINAGAPND